MAKVNHTLTVLSSTDELLTFLSETPRKPDAFMESEKGKADFSGTASYAEAERFARHGWKEGTSKMQDVLGAARMASNESTVQTYSVAGYAPSVPRFLGGAPDCMRAHGKGYSAARPVISFFVNCAYLHYIDNSAIINRGAALASIVDALSIAGYNVEVIAAMGVRCNGASSDTFALTVPIKKPDAHLDIEKLVFYIACPAFLRRLGFRFIENSHTARDVGAGYGQSYTLHGDADQITLGAGDNSEFNTINETFESAYADLARCVTEQYGGILG